MLTLILFVYFVSFLDKSTEGTPALSPRAVEQRAKWSIATDALDYPVNALYVDSLQRMGARVCHTSRWFNGATVEMDEATAAAVGQLDFVTEVEMTRDDSEPIYGVGKRRQKTDHSVDRVQTDLQPDLLTDRQLDVYNLRPLHTAGYEGQGILMTICDVGFAKADTLSCFRRSQELGHFDFTDDATPFYGSAGNHGTACLSAISGLRADYRGAATRANYYLMRSEEMPSESPKEMDNLVAALEKADSLGVNIFSVSLGYYQFDNSDWNLPYSSLNGVTTRCSHAATIAARKGMLVCVAAGNEGNKPWGTINVPSDADSVLTVGAVTTDSVIGDFSSHGPSADGRVKPEVCAVGVQATLIAPDNSVYRSNGTSFATPLLAGMAACLWSALPDENAMQIRERILRSAHLYPGHDADYLYGYGIPDAWKAYAMSPVGIENTEDRIQKTDSYKIVRNGEMIIVRNGHEYTVIGAQKR